MTTKPMREAMPQCAAWVDALRDVFGPEYITEQIRIGLEEGTCWFAEGGHYIGRPGQPRPVRRHQPSADVSAPTAAARTAPKALRHFPYFSDEPIAMLAPPWPSPHPTSLHLTAPSPRAS